MGSFHIMLHFGGVFTKVGENLLYTDGKVIEIGPFECKTFSVSSFQEAANFWGNSAKMVFCKRDVPLDVGRHSVVSDEQKKELLAEAELHGSVNVYIEKETDETDETVEIVENVVNNADGDNVDDEVNAENEENEENNRDGPYVSTDDDDSEEDMESIDEVETYKLDDEVEEHDLRVGLLYDDVEVLKRIAFNGSLAIKKGLKIQKVEKKKLIIVCVEEGCPWRLYASMDKDTQKIKIKSLNEEHRCIQTGMNKLLNRQRLIELFVHKLRDNPLLKAVDMRSEVLCKYQIRLTLPQCRGARQKCLELFQRDHARQFERLYDYVGELKRSNSGSTIILQCRANVFRRMYICFAALREGWISGCRPVLHLDGAFLKWNLKGEILAAVGRDANDQLFPVAWAIVDVENTKNWRWFIKRITEDLHLGVGEGLTLITDQQKGLIAAIQKVLPVCEHRMCARHIWANFKKVHNSDEIKKCFWVAAKSYTTNQFKNCKNCKIIHDYSPNDGSTFIHVGRRSIDTDTNTIFPMHLQRQKEKMKIKRRMKSNAP